MIAIPLTSIENEDGDLKIETVFSPGANSTINDVSFSKDAIYLNTLENVNGRMIQIRLRNNQWLARKLKFPAQGSVTTLGADSFQNEIYANHENFLTPTSSFYARGIGTELKMIKYLPSRFSMKDLVAEQKLSTSADGTQIPYFFVHKKDFKLDGKNPTLLYGYGGFEISMTPSYQPTLGKVWLARGGVYVLANIRGGGDFGPTWHNAAILEKRQHAFDDFISLVEDL